MRAFVLLSCLLFLFLQSHEADVHMYHYTNGTMKLDDKSPVKIYGLIMHQLVGVSDYILISGLYSDAGIKTIYELVAKTADISSFGNDTNIKAKCFWAVWDDIYMESLEGNVEVNITSTGISYHAKCENRAMHDVIQARAVGTISKCYTYTPLEAVARLHSILGQHLNQDKPYTIVNYAVIGTYSGDDCEWYYRNFVKTDFAKTGSIIVGVDGQHCGIVSADGNMFIHINPTNGIVAEIPMAMARAYFRKGYVFKDYPCHIF